jgi:hypothetical protein
VNPVLTADDGEIVAGHGRIAAAKLLGLAKIPVLRLSHLSEVERRAYVIADNKLAQNAGWDREILAIELQGLVDLDFDVELTGFSLAEAEIVIDEARDSAVDGADPTAEDKIPAYGGDRPAVSRPGDLWILGRHRLICGDARDANAYSTLLGNEAPPRPHFLALNGGVSARATHYFTSSHISPAAVGESRVLGGVHCPAGLL